MSAQKRSQLSVCSIRSPLEALERRLLGDHCGLFWVLRSWLQKAISYHLVSRRCEELSDVVLISGGNDFTDGNVQVYVRQDGRDVTLPLTRFHPEIAEPKDKSPAEMSCEELAAGAAPQLLFMNLTIASAMLNAFYAWRPARLRYGEVYLDIMEGKAQPVARVPSDGGSDR